MSEQQEIKKVKVSQTETSPVVKRDRIPLYKQVRQDLKSYNLDENAFHYHWANGSPANLEKYFNGGYEEVFAKDGKPITRRGKGDEFHQYLLRIPKELYLQDAEGKLQEPREIDESLGKRGMAKTSAQGLNPEYAYGGVKMSDQVGRSVIEKNAKE